MVKINDTYYVLETPVVSRTMYKRDVSYVTTDFAKNGNDDNDVNDIEVPDLSTPVIRRTRGTRPRATAGRSPLDVKFAKNYNEKQHYNLVMPIYSHIVYTTEVSGTAEFPARDPGRSFRKNQNPGSIFLKIKKKYIYSRG